MPSAARRPVLVLLELLRRLVRVVTAEQMCVCETKHRAPSIHEKRLELARLRLAVARERHRAVEAAPERLAVKPNQNRGRYSKPANRCARACDRRVNKRSPRRRTPGVGLSDSAAKSSACGSARIVGAIASLQHGRFSAALLADEYRGAYRDAC